MTKTRYVAGMLFASLFTAGLTTAGLSFAEGDLGDGVRLSSSCAKSVSYDNLTDQQIRELHPD